MHTKNTSFQNLSKKHHKGSMKTARHQKALPWKCRLHACLAVPVLSQKPSQVIHNAKHTQHKIFIQWIGNLKHALQFFCSTSVPLPTVRENHRCGLEFEWWRVMQHFYVFLRPPKSLKSLPTISYTLCTPAFCAFNDFGIQANCCQLPA